MNDGFTDLRLNRQEGQVNESFWPSFTDIMTTVVMIFLIAMVVLLLRNMELVRQLRATMEAERIAAELARATGQEKESLALALHRTEAELDRAREEIRRLRAQAGRHERRIAAQAADLARLAEARDALARSSERLAQERRRLEGRLRDREARLSLLEQSLKNRELELRAARSDVDGLRASVDRLRARLGEAQERAERLQQDLDERGRALELARQAAQEAEHRYQTLAGDYDSLKVKYDKLVRPARSPSGRHVVVVRYWKQDGRYRIAWHEGEQGEFQPISRDRLDRVLTRLRETHPEGLYVRVIFPADSGLSYNEAWEFTNHLHRNYDYYFREEAQSPEDASGADRTR